jgi:hypothetical protein
MATNPQLVADTPVSSSLGQSSGLSKDFHAELERALMVTYLRARGHTLRSVRNLPPDEAHAVLRAANIYTALRLTAIEARMHYLDALHGHS